MEREVWAVTAPDWPEGDGVPRMQPVAAPPTQTVPSAFGSVSALPAHPYIGQLALPGLRASEVPQAQEAHDPTGHEDGARQEKGQLETLEE